MRFEIIRASASGGQESPPIEGAQLLRDAGDGSEWFVEVSSLEDLMALQQRAGHDLILSGGNALDGLPKIWIYDDYME